MDRRSFLKALGAGAVSVTIPLSTAMAAPAPITMEGRLPLPSKLNPNGMSGNEILQGNEEALACYTASLKAELFDYGHRLGVGIEVGIHRHGVIAPFSPDGSSGYQIRMASRIMADVFNDWIEHNPKLPRFQKITTKQVENAIKLVV